ncbi:MAG TPA: hypothetical protein VIM73_11780 [Polyangiaceae bacterium]
MRRWKWCLLVALMPACTFEDGHGFTTVRDARLAVAFEPGAREFEGAILTADGHRLRIDSFRLRAVRVELQELERGSAAGGQFDPANPPPGYSLCHGGHCHAEDGRLVDYAEVEAELDGGGARFLPVAAFPVARSLDVLGAEDTPLDRVDPSPELPQASLRRVSVFAERIEISGTLSSPLGDDFQPFSVALAVPLVFASGIDVESSREGPEVLRPQIALEIDGTLFDGVDWSSLETDGEIRVEDPDSSAALAVLSNLAASEVTLTLE